MSARALHALHHAWALRRCLDAGGEAAHRPSMDDSLIEIWTDGACSGNPGPGGWGAVIRWNGHEKEIFGSDPSTTNNRMEMQAVIEALNTLKRPARVILHVDSTYVKDGKTKWIHGWKRNGWKTADRKPVRNQDLWIALEQACERHDILWRWVKGHAGDPMNERADALARRGTQEARLQTQKRPD